MKLTSLILIALLTAGALSTITPTQPLAKHSMLEGDYFYQDLNTLFDLSKVTYPLIVTGNNAIANNQTESYMDKHFQQFDFQNLDWIQQVNEDTLVFCYDRKNIIVQVMKGEGKTFGYYQKFTLASVDVVCHDTAHYEHRAQLFVGCVSKTSTPSSPGSVYIATWDYEQAKITNIEITEQKDGFRIQNRLGMFISEKSSGSGAPTPYLTVYDVGNTNAKQTRGNTQLRVYRNVSIGKLRFYKLLKIDDHLYDILYNLFPYQESIILSGRVSGPTSTVITLASCVFNFDKAVLSCDPKLKGTAVTEGMIGLNSSGHYFEINTQTNKITVAALHGRFADNNWNRDVLYTQSNLDLIHNESAFIRYYTGTGAMGVINYGTLAGGPDYGYTGISYASGISWGVVGSVAAQIGNSVVFGVSDQSGEHQGDVVSIMRPTNPYLLVDSSKLPSGQTSVVGLEIEDADSTTPYSVSGSFTVVATIFDKINVLSSAYGDITIKGGYTTELELKDEDIVQGNSIEVTATSADNSVHGKSYSGAKLNITWNPSHDHNDILSYQFFGQKAVVQNTRGSMWFYNCRRNSGSHDRICDQYASYPGPVSLPIVKVTYLSNVLFTWTCSNGNCFAIFVQNNGDVSLVNIGGGVKDMFFGLDNQIPNWIRLVVTTNDSVEIFRSSKYEPSGMTLWYTISQDNSSEDWFCPTNIYHCPDNEDILEILNDCQGYNQKVLKYRIGDMKVDFLNKTNLDSLTINPFFCPMGSEFIVGSTSS